MTPEVRVLPDATALSDAAALFIESIARGASMEQPLTLALAGGSTPRAMYQHLAGRTVAWAKVRVFFGDERCVPPADEGSNYRMAREAMLDRVPISPPHLHRIFGELPPEDAARRAEDDLRAHVSGDPVPRLDLIILGMGPDGHTASLFPGGPETEVTDRLMVPVHRPELPQPWRVSMTLPVLNAARRVVFLVADGAKAPMVARAIAGDESIPAGRVRPTDGELIWMVTEAAAEHGAKLGPRRTS
jgi:6-phosphogluconolactonase